jgi:ComEC/Rec2-related protein
MVTRAKINIPFIPITHVIFACTACVLLTSFALLENQMHWLYLMLGLGIATILKTKKYHYFLVLIMAVACCWHVKQRLHELEQAFHADQEFLNTPVFIKAQVLQKQCMYLDKDQATVLVQTKAIIKNKTMCLKKPKKIMVMLSLKKAQGLQPGQHITIARAKLQQPKPDQEFYRYLLKENMWASAYLTTEKIFIHNKFTHTWLTEQYEMFCALLSQSTIQLFNPLFLGKREKSLTSVNMQHQSLYWGIAHHMARSGIHLVTIFGLFMSLLHFTRIRHTYRYFLCALLATGYLGMSISSLSFLRAFYMIMMQMICKINQYAYSSTHALALTTLVIVSHNPYCIMFLDFQLSFGITAVIIWLFQRKWTKTVVLPGKNLLPS